MNALLLAAAIAAPLGASESASFLRLGVGARALGMGGAHTAVAADAHAAGWNPAGLSGLARPELGFTHAELFDDARYDYAAFAQPTRLGTIGASGAYLSQGSLQGRDERGRPTGGFTAADSAASVSFAARGLGASVKFVQSRIADASAQTVAFDLGARRELPGRGPGVPMVGLSLLNLGPGLRFADERSQLPLTAAAGVAYRLPLGLLLAADFKHRPHSRQNEVSVGTEYAVLSGFAVRAGYGAAARSGLGGMAAGFGIKAFDYSIDYSMTPFGELGNVQRFSLGARF